MFKEIYEVRETREKKKVVNNEYSPLMQLLDLPLFMDISNHLALLKKMESEGASNEEILKALDIPALVASYKK